jgi:hypothetical protein
VLVADAVRRAVRAYLYRELMMDIQTLIVALIVLVAAVFVGNRFRRTVLAARASTGKGKNCGGDCGCSH